jgi:hypothetical protein
VLLSQLKIGEAYAFAPDPEQAWEQGSARKAYYVKRLHSRNEVPINPAIEWMFGHPQPVNDDPEVLVLTQWDFTGLVGRIDNPRVEIASDEWRPAAVGRKQLMWRWADFEERIQKLFEIGQQYQTYIAKIRWRLGEIGIPKSDVLALGAWDAFEPEKVVVRIAGLAGLQLGRDVPSEMKLEFRAEDLFKLQPGPPRRLRTATRPPRRLRR